MGKDAGQSVATDAGRLDCVRYTANQRKNIAFGIAALLVAGFSVWLSLDPANYFFYRTEQRQDWRHPTIALLFLCAIYLGEALCVARAIRLDAHTRLWPRTSVAALLFLPWVAFSSMFVMHAPRFLHVHVVWTWLLLATLIVVALGSAARHAIHRIRGNPEMV